MGWGSLRADAPMTSLSVVREEGARFLVAGSLDIYGMPEGRAPAAPGEAPTYVNAQHLPPQATPASGSSAESSPRKDLFDMSGLPFVWVSCLLRLLSAMPSVETCAVSMLSASRVLMNRDDRLHFSGL